MTEIEMRNHTVNFIFKAEFGIGHKQDIEKCAICINEFKEEENVRRLRCSHEFHMRCVDKWLKANTTCPMCRQNVKRGDCFVKTQCISSM